MDKKLLVYDLILSYKTHIIIQYVLKTNVEMSSYFIQSFNEELFEKCEKQHFLFSPKAYLTLYSYTIQFKSKSHKMDEKIKHPNSKVPKKKKKEISTLVNFQF